MKNLREIINEKLRVQKGHVGFWYKNLVTGETIGYQQDEAFLAASVIKLPMFLCIAKWVEEGKASWDETIKIRPDDK